MLDKEGKPLGSIEGVFVLTRQAPQQAPDLADEALRGAVLEPNVDNTQLLYENPDLGIRFLHSRRWHVAGLQATQIALDDANGNGLLVTVEPAARMPSAAQFLNETRTYLQQQKAKVLRVDPPQRWPAGRSDTERFAIQVEVGGQRAFMDYFVVQLASGGGVLVAARLSMNDLANLRSEVEKIIRSIQSTK